MHAMHRRLWGRPHLQTRPVTNNGTETRGRPFCQRNPLKAGTEQTHLPLAVLALAPFFAREPLFSGKAEVMRSRRLPSKS